MFPPPSLGLISHWKKMPTETKVCQQKATWELSPRSQTVTNHVENGEHQQRLLVTAAPRLGHIPGKDTWAEWHLGKRQRLVDRAASCHAGKMCGIEVGLCSYHRPRWETYREEGASVRPHRAKRITLAPRVQLGRPKRRQSENTSIVRPICAVSGVAAAGSSFTLCDLVIF